MTLIGVEKALNRSTLAIDTAKNVIGCETVWNSRSKIGAVTDQGAPSIIDHAG